MSARPGLALATRRPWVLRALLFLYGNGNIAGCALGLLGPALLFAGVIGQGWWLITLGLYALGWLLGSTSTRAPEIDRRIENALTVEQTMERLDELNRRVGPHLLPDMNAHLASVRDSVAEVLPKLMDSSGFDADLYTVRETVFRYLPETLANYVALPTVFRASHALKDGKTARQLLSEQLALLDTKMREIVANVASADAQALLANGKFLEMKFQQPDFLVR